MSASVAYKKADTMPDSQTANTDLLALHPTWMSQAFVLVPEDHVSDPGLFLQRFKDGPRHTSDSLTLGKLFKILRRALRGIDMPRKLPL
jgi:hypothetical protein